MTASPARATTLHQSIPLAIGLAVLCHPATAAPQEGTAEFAYTGTALTVYLEAGHGPGSIDVRDGPTGRVRVTDATGEGDPVFLLHGDRLLIVHRSDQPARYRLDVPREAAVSISLAGRRLATVAAVDSIDIAHPEALRALKIVLEGSRFQVGGDRSVSFGYHEPSRWGVITPRVPGVMVTVRVPTDAGSLQLRVGDDVIWELAGTRGRAYCEPVAEVRRPAGGAVWVFSFQDGTLRCRVPGSSRPAA